ncbi:hypothetical protein [Amycolatopsis lexingtonensis]|uniref:hypothetical protein n=1 Tax=Amycolatopsis lexingtonensis TaxID=218822 RepID=UPI000A35ECE6|nr:hypothetical protein [Amycolatopsis lexingtonensis]
MITVPSTYTFEGPGFVHGGTGDQHNHFVLEMRRRRPAQFVAGEHIKWLAERFVWPAPLGRRALRDSRTLVLTGPEGSGRRSAALMCLTEQATLDAGRLRELSDRSEDDGPALDPADIRPGERLLLDLTHTDDHHVRELRRELEGFRAAVDDQDARLVVVIRREQRILLPESLIATVIPIDRPSGPEVFEAYLSAEGLSLPKPLPPLDAPAPFLATSPMREVVELASLTTAVARRTGRGTLAEWAREAVAAHSERGEQAAALFREHQDPVLRALLVVSAFLPGATLDAMVEAEGAFSRLVNLPREEKHVLDGAYLAERMAMVRLHTDGRKAVEFKDLALDKAVRTHFWTYFPELRDKMSEWVAVVTALPNVGMPAASALADHYADQVLTTGPVSPLQDLARRWSANDGQKVLALQVLDAGLQHSTYSPEFRKFVYHRAKNPNTEAGFAEVLIEACTETIAPERPTQAMVRLHYFTGHSNPSVRALAHRRLLALVSARGFERWLLHRLATVSPRPTDSALLLALDIPARLAAERSAKTNLRVLWHRLLAEGISTLPEAPVQRWLDQHPALLVEACDGQVRLLSTLYAFARDQVDRAVDGEARQVRRESALTLQHFIDAAMAPVQPEEL